MPNKNGQGPQGAGSLTGRGRGLCNGNDMPQGRMHRRSVQSAPAALSQQADSGCRGPRGCGKGMRGQGANQPGGGMARG